MRRTVENQKREVSVEIFGCCADGLFCLTLGLAEFAKARAQLERCELFSVRLVGSLL